MQAADSYIGQAHDSYYYGACPEQKLHPYQAGYNAGKMAYLKDQSGSSLFSIFTTHLSFGKILLHEEQTLISD